ncbi:MAG: Crp/Fnr family transcriptional regulator [Pseudomonadota bacterium]
MTDPALRLAPMAKRLGRGAALTSDDCAAVLAMPHVAREFEAGQYLLREGDRPKYCSFMLSGFTYRHKFVGDGGRQIVSIHIPGDFIDLQNMLLDTADHNIQALTGSVVAQVDVEVVAAHSFAHPGLGRGFWRESLVEASIFREWVANIGRRDARSRTAHLLCELATRREAAGLGARDTFELPMTQEQLGDALGLTAVHVNRTLKALHDDGLITRSKRSVSIADWARLRDTADFTSGYLHLA